MKITSEHTAPPRRGLAARLRSAFEDRRGGTTAWAVFWTIGLCMVGGVAVDTSNAYSYKIRLQSVADASAMVAAMNITDPTAARAAAVALAETNMPASKHGQVIRPEDVVFGKPAEDGSFVPLDDNDPDVESVRVTAGRDGLRGSPVPTWMLKLASNEPWTVNVQSTAWPRFAVLAAEDPNCAAANIIAKGFISAGGSNQIGPHVCIQGETGVHFGGNDVIEPGAHVSAPDEGTITLGWMAPGSDSPENIIHEAETKTPILDAMGSGELFEAYWNAIWASGVKMYGFGPHKNYFGPALPKWLFKDADGRAFPVRTSPLSNPPTLDFTFQPGQVMANGVYLWNGDVTFAGDVEFENAAFFVTGKITFGGGWNNGNPLRFKNVFFFAKGGIQAAGNILWGDTDAYCERGEYTVYMLSHQNVGLGGWGSPNEGINGVFIAAANEYQPGGAMIAGGGGLYVEAGSTGTTSLGGQAKLRGCSDQLSAALEAFPLDDGDTGYEAAGGPDLTGYAFPNAGDGAQAAAN